jgi:hypothetical protein
MEPVEMTTRLQQSLLIRRRLLGLFALSFFILHGLYYLRHGGLSHMLWMCNIGNLLLAIGLFFDQAIPVRVAVFWLIPGVFLWFYFMALQGGFLFTSMISHLGGLAVGIMALRRVGVTRATWLYALLWYLLVQQICRLATPAEPNVNVAHNVFEGWETIFRTYWQFWIATTTTTGIGLWILEIALLKLLSPPSSRQAHSSFSRMAR